ncbi:MAG: hypothetical protein K0R57_3262 [Paenibacillaceae bacterium]|jgi:hypothetical protein|nr:hypothetical protein [Paenibacillaceae bacterium]
MKVVGIVVHHSVCSAINGKGYDFLILKNGSIIPAAQPTDPNFIHICLEGDFSDSAQAESAETKEQLFLFQKLILRLSRLHNFSGEEIFPHSRECPGKYFPWSRLVISGNDGYH